MTFYLAAAGNVTGSITVASNASNGTKVIALSGMGTSAVHSVALSWSPSVSTVTGYNVYVSTVSGGCYTKRPRILSYGGQLYGLRPADCTDALLRGYVGGLQQRRERLLESSVRSHSLNRERRAGGSRRVVRDSPPGPAAPGKINCRAVVAKNNPPQPKQLPPSPARNLAYWSQFQELLRLNRSGTKSDSVQ